MTGRRFLQKPVKPVEPRKADYEDVYGHMRADDIFMEKYMKYCDDMMAYLEEREYVRRIYLKIKNNLKNGKNKTHGHERSAKESHA